MFEILFILFLLIGFLGMAVIVLRKMPRLREIQLSEKESSPGKRIKKGEAFRTAKGEKLLQTVLSKVRILTLRTESKTGDWLGKLRKRSIRDKEEKFEEGYWENLRKK